MTDEEEIASLMDDMRSGDENRLIGASVMLAQFGPQVVPELTSILSSPYPLTRDYTAMSLGLLGSAAEPALPNLCKAVSDTDSGVRYATVVAIGNIGKKTEETLQCLRSALNDTDEMTRRGAADALTKLRDS
jgi:HEAT repeat protein